MRTQVVGNGTSVGAKARHTGEGRDIPAIVQIGGAVDGRAVGLEQRIDGVGQRVLEQRLLGSDGGLQLAALGLQVEDAAAHLVGAAPGVLDEIEHFLDAGADDLRGRADLVGVPRGGPGLFHAAQAGKVFLQRLGALGELPVDGGDVRLQLAPRGFDVAHAALAVRIHRQVAEGTSVGGVLPQPQQLLPDAAVLDGALHPVADDVQRVGVALGPGHDVGGGNGRRLDVGWCGRSASGCRRRRGLGILLAGIGLCRRGRVCAQGIGQAGGGQGEQQHQGQQQMAQPPCPRLQVVVCVERVFGLHARQFTGSGHKKSPPSAGLGGDLNRTP